MDDKANEDLFGEEAVDSAKLDDDLDLTKKKKKKKKKGELDLNDEDEDIVDEFDELSLEKKKKKKKVVDFTEAADEVSTETVHLHGFISLYRSKLMRQNLKVNGRGWTEILTKRVTFTRSCSNACLKLLNPRTPRALVRDKKSSCNRPNWRESEPKRPVSPILRKRRSRC